ncbi:copper chaperone [Schinkia azotoformans MEV2011]|uniref:Heavy metal-chaperone/transport protein n=2 Tax=Schinkia azotoformans TaxID=1454 RepID=K6D8V6_SCHAZ|nr:heavy-metal-associated domain-containing protein [Schinkia azotoformans]EKN68967.1 heavy metal-chaperone/transport protein [Schinkia azotoformans LMG 9581]KEF37759.1 copper chaperone [Schinkia azotoformans MEV2011]MEC1638439.1 heavy-metal-associated domain-containing protein [Schinkia azotoformans]MEC1695622.1 heavy-metal-associated domain-containing protein [Schinkia azotoformans]MEC1717658.1 heavy-metal-associated domain-containing protein [Schinkia azotoformans]
MKTVKFQMEELTCPSCIKKIEGVLSKQEGVSEVKVLFNSSKVKVIFDENLVSAENLASTIKKLGYQVLNRKIS